MNSADEITRLENIAKHSDAEYQETLSFFEFLPPEVFKKYKEYSDATRKSLLAIKEEIKNNPEMEEMGGLTIEEMGGLTIEEATVAIFLGRMLETKNPGIKKELPKDSKTVDQYLAETYEKLFGEKLK